MCQPEVSNKVLNLHAKFQCLAKGELLKPTKHKVKCFSHVYESNQK